MKETNKRKSKVNDDDFEIINELIDKQIISENVVSNYIIKHYDNNIIYEYSSSDFLENLKKSYKYYLELMDAINDVKSIACKLGKTENKLFCATLEKFSSNLTNDKQKLTSICRRFCSMFSQTRSKSNILDKVQKTVKANKEENVTLNKLKELSK